jgi:hypothetical protein
VQHTEHLITCEGSTGPVVVISVSETTINAEVAPLNATLVVPVRPVAKNDDSHSWGALHRTFVLKLH